MREILVRVETQSRPPGRDLVMDWGIRKEREVTPRFLSTAWEDGGKVSRKGFHLKKCLVGIWETSLWRFREVVGTEGLGFREAWSTDRTLSAVAVGGL